jgi:hypothetical protein
VEMRSGHVEKLRCRGTRGGIAGLASGGADCSKGVAANEERLLLDYLATKGCVSSFMF